MLEDMRRACVLDHKGRGLISLSEIRLQQKLPGEHTDRTFEEGPVSIVDSRDQVLRRKTVRLVLVLWRHYGVEESTWEHEDTMQATYPFLFRDEDT